MRDVWERLDEITSGLPTEHWILIGGLMVHAHAIREDVRHVRPTDDADLVVELATTSYPAAARAVEALGYALHQPIDSTSPVHRFSRDGGHVDLMAPEGSTARFAGRDVVVAPGTRSALRRTVQFQLPSGTLVRIPDLASSLSLKGAAYGLPGANRVRHLQDAVTLFACATTDLELSKSMRTNVNTLVRGLDHVDAWGLADASTRRRAVRALRALRPDWDVPPFVLPQRA